jgi:hypothetical protein
MGIASFRLCDEINEQEQQQQGLIYTFFAFVIDSIEIKL